MAVDLSHWDFAEHFSAYEAGALILGIEPSESREDEWRIRIVTERMSIHYKNALDRYRIESAPFGDMVDDDPHAARPIELESVEMSALHRRKWLYDDETSFDLFLSDKRNHDFDMQEFHRHTIAQWLKAINMKSVYAFEAPDPEAALAKPETPAPVQTRWPWGDHHTEALGHLEAAAKEFWTDYDPSSPKTAPKSTTVSTWLTERGVAQYLADAMATILRADGLPTGPRK